ncbi:MAG: hypothetical protein MI757_06345 [Pirellulales bacterium]|nr:hypothetical protein [Pirellulales bacterium]
MSEQTRHLEEDAWLPCPDGEIQSVAQRERSRRSARKLTRVASTVSVAAVAVILAVVGTRYWLEQQMEAPGPQAIPRVLASIGCGEVIEHLPAYVSDTLHRDHPEVYSAVFVHLQHCPHCDAKKKQLRSAQTAIVPAKQGLVDAGIARNALFAEHR